MPIITIKQQYENTISTNLNNKTNIPYIAGHSTPGPLQILEVLAVPGGTSHRGY